MFHFGFSIAYTAADLAAAFHCENSAIFSFSQPALNNNASPFKFRRKHATFLLHNFLLELKLLLL